jgi:hypothetical protein
MTVLIASRPVFSVVCAPSPWYSRRRSCIERTRVASHLLCHCQVLFVVLGRLGQVPQTARRAEFGFVPLRPDCLSWALIRSRVQCACLCVCARARACPPKATYCVSKEMHACIKSGCRLHPASILHAHVHTRVRHYTLSLVQ